MTTTPTATNHMPGLPPLVTEPEQAPAPNHRRIVKSARRCVKIFLSSLPPEFPDDAHRASVLRGAWEFVQEAFRSIDGPFGTSSSDRDKCPRISHNRTPRGRVIAVVTWRNRLLS